MKNEDMALVIGAAVVLYFIVNNQGVSAAQAQINATNLNAQANVQNANAIASSGIAISNDLSTLIGAWS